MTITPMPELNMCGDLSISMLVSHDNKYATSSWVDVSASVRIPLENFLQNSICSLISLEIQSVFNPLLIAKKEP